MKCYLPVTTELPAAGRRLLRIAEILGADCVELRLPAGSSDPIGDIENGVAEQEACIAICPTVAKEWLGIASFPSSLANYLSQRFKFLLIHGLDSDPVSCDMLLKLSQGTVSGVTQAKKNASLYQVAKDDVTGAFGGLEVSPVNSRDHVFLMNEGQTLVKPIISIGGKPLFARLTASAAQIFLLSGITENHLDLEGDLDARPVAEYFPQLLPIAMFIRHAFKDECWHPSDVISASLIIDDPPLWKRYGYVNYERISAFMDQYRFHMTMAFIPYYWRRYSTSTVRLFRERPDRFSICFHGNDHTDAEMAATDPRVLAYCLTTAQARMERFTARTGIRCGKVMAFPQGAFSRSALAALKEHNFIGAVNWGHIPTGGQRPALTLANVLQPSIRYEDGCPFFLRRPVKRVRPEDIAMDAFVGRPILLQEHHELFRDPTALFETVTLINRMLPEVTWRDLQSSLEMAYLVRKSTDSTVSIRPCALALQIKNTESNSIRYDVEWPDQNANVSLGSGSQEYAGVGHDDAHLHSFTLAPGEVGSASQPREARAAVGPVFRPSFARIIKIGVRRTLAELRDNYLSRSPVAISVVKSMRNILFSPHHAP